MRQPCLGALKFYSCVITTVKEDFRSRRGKRAGRSRRIMCLVRYDTSCLAEPIVLSGHARQRPANVSKGCSLYRPAAVHSGKKHAGWCETCAQWAAAGVACAGMPYHLRVTLTLSFYVQHNTKLW